MNTKKRKPSLARLKKVVRKYKGDVRKIAANIGYTRIGTYRLLYRLGLR